MNKADKFVKILSLKERSKDIEFLQDKLRKHQEYMDKQVDVLFEEGDRAEVQIHVYQKQKEAIELEIDSLEENDVVNMDNHISEIKTILKRIKEKT